MRTYAIRAKSYRGQAGWIVGSRGNEGHWPISIFTTDRGIAETIRQAYRDCEAGRITPDERDAVTDRELIR